MSYAKKLEAFNATEKYKSELRFLRGLIGEGHKYVLDYGCGTGKAVDYLQLKTNNNIAGYDKTKHNEKFWYVDPASPYDVTYFMHSIAHIEDPKRVLENLNAKQVIIITPNADWIAVNHKRDYTPDPTIINHFTQNTLGYLLNSAGYKNIITGQFGAETKNQNERLFLIAEKI